MTEARALAILEMLKCKSDKSLMKMKYTGGWLGQRKGSFTKRFVMAVRTLKTGRWKANFGV
ncbi:hypothetical protein NYE27_07840 [Paenibacillus sp. FSL R10-2779]|uniref:hypothetical protein n=1 Tax=Paenibacillus TaxID=44249 RepID=UPI001140B42B|nr:hypothetical protein [Paenibacillus odorifer]